MQVRDARNTMQDARYGMQETGITRQDCMLFVRSVVLGECPVNVDFSGFFVFTRRDTGAVSLHQDRCLFYCPVGTQYR